MEEDLFKDFQAKLKVVKDDFIAGMRTLQTGRAHPALLDGIVVDVYESKLPLNQTASISVGDAATLQVTPFDSGNIDVVRNAIAAFERTDYNPTDDGRNIYVKIPPLTTERRQQIVKNLHVLREEFHIRLRQARHHILKELKETGEAEDQFRGDQKRIDALSTKVKDEIDGLAAGKEEEIMKLG